MFLSDVICRSALAQSQLLRGGAISVEELTRAYLERSERLDPRLGAFVQFTPERALRRARALDRVRSRGRLERLGPLWGLPTAMKDLHLVRGMFVRLGSRAFRHVWSPVDDVSTAAVREAGMVITGKLSTSELGILPYIDVGIHPPTRNPWDTDLYAGGSSGGSGAAVAAGMIPLAVASDGGGSIRIPASLCGLVGHKPTRGYVPSPFERHEPLGLSVVGPHARSVDDAAALMDALLGPRPGPPLLEAVQRPPGRMRVRFTTSNPVWAPGPAEQEAVRRAARELSALGHEVEEGDFIAGDIDEFLPMFFFLARGMFVPFEGALQPTTRWLRGRGEGLRLEDVVGHRELFRGRVDRWFSGVDLWVTPTVAGPAPRVGAFDGETPEGRMYAAAPLGAFTAAFNASGNPATTVPMWSDGRATPVGVQLVAPRGHDLRALSAARALMLSLGRPLTPLAPVGG